MGVQVSKSQFKVRALEFFRQIESSGESVVVTDHGQPKLEVRPYKPFTRHPLDCATGFRFPLRQSDDAHRRRRLGGVAVIVLDTHTLLWWASGDKAQLSSAALQAIEAEMDGEQIIVSSISAWELAMLVAKGRVALSMDIGAWLSVVSQIEEVNFVPVNNEIAVKSTELPGEFHKDPADRIIVATARKLAAPLITVDDKIRAYPHVRAIW
jgi:PIN domain nuclease of toxin-antitoxin system